MILMMKDTRCQVFDTLHRDISIITSERAQSSAGHSLLLFFVSFCLLLSASFFLFLLEHSSHPLISLYLNDCMLLPLVNVTRSRSPTKNLQQRRGITTSLGLATADLVHGQCYTWRTDGHQTRVRLPVLSSITF